MRKTREFLHEYRANGGVIVGLCGVRVFEDEEGARRPALVLSEPPEDTGYDGPSVTNNMEQVAAEVVRLSRTLSVAVEESLAAPGEAGLGRPILVIEHYPRGPAERRRGAEETFDLVSFASWRRRQIGWGPSAHERLGEADWEHLGDDKAGERRAGELIGARLGGDGWLGRFRDGVRAALPARGDGPDEVGGSGGPRREHGRREEEHGMLEPLPWDPETGDVVLERVADFEAGLDTGDNLMHRVRTNVPWSVVEHSPSGFEWGYYGSGPADLALNILNVFEPPGADGQEPVACWDGAVSRTAQALHQAFKEDFLAKMPREGGMIRGAEIRAWISERVVREGGRVVGYVPEGARSL